METTSLHGRFVSFLQKANKSVTEVLGQLQDMKG